MNTPAHLIIGIAAFGRADAPKVTLAALIGAMLPDLSLYIMAGVSLFWLGLSDTHVFGTLYFSDAWQQVFAIDNSFVLWGIALAVALWQRSAWAIALAGAALAHIALDFPFHSDDARMHFWPLTDWKFHSPISYWNSDEGAGWFGPIEMICVLALTIFSLRRFPQIWVRITVSVLCLLQLVPFVSWYLFF
ncbi:MAG: cobalamin biosynthesis protein CobQ [Pseudomonadota bacterium]